MSKKKRWWQTGWKKIEQKKIESNNSNAIRQHEERLHGSARPKDDLGFYRDEDPSYHGYDSRDYQSNFDWGLDRNLMEQGKGGTKKGWENSRDEFGSSYGEYGKTGVWRGYDSYRTPQLSYKYVQQMANALAAQHMITVKVGNTWEVDLLKRELTYNPASLVYGTKSELLAILLHEIGKLRYMDHPTKLKNKYLSMYEAPAYEVLGIFEDIRIDFMMLKAYESASEIYESAIPSIEKQVKLFTDNGTFFKKIVIDSIHAHLQSIVEPYQKIGALQSQECKDKLLMTFGASNIEDVEAKVAEMIKYIRENGNIFDYCAAMTHIMYDLDSFRLQFPNIEKKIVLTQGAIEPTKKKQSSQELVDFLDTEVYPHVEDLLKEFKDNAETIEKFFPKMSEDLKNAIVKYIKDKLKQIAQDPTTPLGKGVSMNDKKNTNVRSSGQTDIKVPPEWKKGDYKVLKESVSAEIKQLISKLTFIRREEEVSKYQTDQKRGKLNTRKLYKAALGSRRLFKQKLPNTDTVQSFAFSVLIDVSGSMQEGQGERIVHCTRALVIFAEVFKKVGIPFELIAFSDGATVIKKFEQELDKNITEKIGGLVKHNGGGTNLNEGIEASKIETREEKNRVMVVLTDGGIGNVQYYDNQFFIPMSKKNIKSVGFGVECEDQMKDLCMGNSRVLENAAFLPVEFVELLKSLIKRK